jgi:hypothetical protein
MKKAAVEKARSRLRIAEKATENIQECVSYQEFTDVWYTFLTASKSIWTVLEVGAKDDPESRQWFALKSKQRRADELLTYLFEARNDDEHGIAPVTALKPGYLSIGKVEPGFSNSVFISGSFETELIVRSLDGKPVLIEEQPNTAKLAVINPRGRPPMDPPTTHLGEPLPDDSPLTVATLALNYLTKLIEEAAARS